MKQMGFVDIDKYGGLLVRLDTNEWTAGSNNDFGTRGSALRENPNWSVTPNLTWLRGNHSLPLSEWRERRARAERSRRAEQRYIEKLFTSRSVKGP